MKRLVILLSALFVMVGSSYAFAAKHAANNYSFYDKGTSHGVPYLSGGVGREERLAIAPMEKNYNLMMVFALNSRPYLSNETVKIQNDQGKEVFERNSDGPWLLVKLPAGDYKVTVSRDGHKSEVRHIKVGEGMQVEHFVWKS